MLDGVVHLPLLMPPVVTGYLLLLRFGRSADFSTNPSVSSSRFAPGGDVGAPRLTLVSIALSFVALLTADLLARRLGRRLSSD